MLSQDSPERIASLNAVLPTRKSAAPDLVLAERHGAVHRGNAPVRGFSPRSAPQLRPKLVGPSHWPRCAPERPAGAEGHERCVRQAANTVV
jgi:hypothetical protein